MKLYRFLSFFVYLIFIISDVFSQSWVQIGVDINGQEKNSNLGKAVSTNKDGSIIAIGEPGGAEKGIVSVYRITDSNDLILLGQKIKPSDSFDGGQSTFGSAVDLSENGKILAVSNTGTSLYPGYVEIFEYSDNDNTWASINRIDNPQAGSNLGLALVFQ